MYKQSDFSSNKNATATAKPTLATADKTKLAV
jgi:hypothetical protein